MVNIYIMKYVKTFEELRLDKLKSMSPGKDQKGVRGWKGSNNYKFVRHQNAKAKRAEGKKIVNDVLKGEEPKINENLKSIVAGALLGLSTILSSPLKSQDMFDISNPIGFTNPMSPNNPVGIMNPASPISIYNTTNQSSGGSYYFTYYRDETIKEIDQIGVKDENLIKSKTELSKEPLDIDVDTVYQSLKLYTEINLYKDLANVLDTINKVNIEQVSKMSQSEKEDTRSHLLKIIENLKLMQRDVDGYNTEKYICISLIVLMVGLLLGTIVAIARI